MAKDAKALLSEFEMEADKEREELERKLREKREKKLESITGPLMKRRSELAQQVNDANTEIETLDKQLREIRGEKERPTKAAKGKRRRLNDVQKMELAEVLFKKMKGSSKNRFSSGDLEGFSDGVPPRVLIDHWNTAHKGAEAIHHEGEKRSRRYWVN